MCLAVGVVSNGLLELNILPPTVASNDNLEFAATEEAADPAEAPPVLESIRSPLLLAYALERAEFEAVPVGHCGTLCSEACLE